VGKEDICPLCREELLDGSHLRRLLCPLPVGASSVRRHIYHFACITDSQESGMMFRGSIDWKKGCPECRAPIPEEPARIRRREREEQQQARERRWVLGIVAAVPISLLTYHWLASNGYLVPRLS
jgi:hypothetical protein